MSIQRVMMSADAVGGVWNYALELAAGLAEHGIVSRIAVLGPAPDAVQQRAAQHIPGLSWCHGDFPLEWMEGAIPAQAAAGRWLLAQARDFQPDVLHLNHYSHGHLPWPAPAFIVAHSCVLSWHKQVRGEVPGQAWQAYRDAVTCGLQAAACVVAPTQAMLKDIIRFYGPLRAQQVIANGRRAEDFPPRRKRAQILSAGRLWDEAKNIRLLAALSKPLGWPIMLAGEVQHPQGGQATGGERLRLLGRLDAQAMAMAYGEAAIYALPARYEPFGLSVLEAALAGCALVVGDIPSLRELWQDAALFVPVDDAAALHAALTRLIENDHLRQVMAEGARTRALHYSRQRMTQAYLALYTSLIRRSASSLCIS